jgi:hypothetical protein
MRLFDVTTPKTTVDLGGTGTTDVNFNVSNVSGRTARANFAISPVDPAKPSWFSFPPGTEPGFDFTQQNGTTQVHVIVAPTDAAPGSYAFKLRAIDAQDPGRSYDESPTVAFTVKPREKKPFPWLLVVIIVVVLAIIGGVVAYVKQPKKPAQLTVPTAVLGMTYQQGVNPSPLASAGLTSSPANPCPWPPNIIVGTQPAPGQPIAAGGNVVLILGACIPPANLNVNPNITKKINDLPKIH